MVRPPFSVRSDPEQHEAFYALRQGVPAGLLPSLLGWTLDQYASMPGVLTDEDKLGHLERVVGRHIVSSGRRESLSEFSKALEADAALLLDAADIALKWASDHSAEVLEAYLREARSVYRVGTDADGYGALQRRQSEEMIDLVESESNQPGRAATHLRNAWSKCFGLNPDPKGACREAVEAVEVAAKRVVTPTDSMPSLGKMCGAIRDKPEKWETDSEFDRSVESVRSMMELVWNEGRFRHGDESTPVEVSQEAAEMTVQTAVLLVSWFRSGRIRLKS